MCYRMGLGVSLAFTAEPSYKSTRQQCILTWRGLWWSCRSLCRCQLTLALKTSVLTETGGMVWLLRPCDTLVTEISVFSLLVPALLRRFGSHPWIEGLRCTQGFALLHKRLRTVSGFICAFGLFGSDLVFHLGFNITNTTSSSCKRSRSCEKLVIKPSQVLAFDYQFYSMH